ncbi:MAG: hypothetical protein QNK35_10715 [Bacteroides sp.]|nr:hypothetical protein [Bacteroides sp.]
MGKLNRREFAKTSLVLGSAVGLFPHLAYGAHGKDSDQSTWFDKPMRWAQLTLVENDPGQYDPDFWLDYFKRTHSDAVCLSAGGIVAYYPTQIEFHHRSLWMGDSDPFGYLLQGCRDMDMVVIARTDPHAIWPEAFSAHPEWAAVDRAGNKKIHWSNPDLYVTCALGPYNFEFMTEVHGEIMKLYALDGIFSNRWAGHGVCYCENCKKNFYDFSGMNLPQSSQRLDPVYQKWDLWQSKRLYELWQLWDSEIRSINPKARFIPNGFPDKKIAGEQSDILFTDHQARRGLTPPWDNGKRAKEYRAIMGKKPIGGIFSMGLEEPYRWKDSVQSEAEVRTWVADGTANGMRPWYTKFSGTLYDNRWLSFVEDIYSWHHKAENYLRNERPMASVGMLYSEQTERYYGGEKHQNRVGDFGSGMYHALIEARVPFEMVHDLCLDAEHIDQFKLLILPNIAALSDKQNQQIVDYVGRGGSILATYETSLYNEKGEKRNDFGLSELLGVSFNGEVEGPMKNSYLRLARDKGKSHPVLNGLEDTTRIINGVYRLGIKANIEFPSPLTLIPSYPDLPMEHVYPREAITDIRELYLRETAESRIVYFPWDIERTFWEILSVDHGKLIRNAVHWALNENLPVTVLGQGILDITVWEQKQSMTVHLVNLTNPMMMKGPIREIIPLNDQEVIIRVPEGKKVRKAQLLVSGLVPDYKVLDGSVKLLVQKIMDHEVIALDFTD